MTNHYYSIALLAIELAIVQLLAAEAGAQTVSFTCLPDPSLPLTVTCTDHTNDPRLLEEERCWTFGDAPGDPTNCSAPDAGNCVSSERTQRHTYDTAGEYEVRLVNSFEDQTLQYSLCEFRTLTIEPPECQFQITPSQVNFRAEGGESTFTVNRLSGDCSWQARADRSWIEVQSQSASIVRYKVSGIKTTKNDRSGTITVLGNGFNKLIFNIEQDRVCDFCVFPDSATAGPHGVSDTFNVDSNKSYCKWVLENNNADNLKINRDPHGNGDQLVPYTVHENISAEMLFSANVASATPGIEHARAGERMFNKEANPCFDALDPSSEEPPKEFQVVQSAQALLVPGFVTDVDNPEGATTLYSVRNTTDEMVRIDVTYHDERIAGEPLRTNVFTLEPRQTLTRDVRTDLSGLGVNGGFATGLISITDTEVGASRLEGDYFRIDWGNDFATGDRLVRTDYYCPQQEVRFVDFENGSRLRILLARPQGPATPSFSYTAVNEAGTIVVEGDFFTSDHVTTIDVKDLVPGHSFGTLVFDFSNSIGGFVTAEYSAFERFSVELNGVCRASVPKACVPMPLACNSTVTGTLSADDCPLGAGIFYDQWQFAGNVGTNVIIDLMSDDFDTYLSLLNPVSAIAATGDDGGAGTDSFIAHTLDSTGTWSIQANNSDPGSLGDYTLTLACEGVEPPNSQLLVPGFEVEVEDPEGPTTFFAVRNTTDDDIMIDVAYHGEQITDEPLRTDDFMLEPQQTLTRDVRSDLSDLNVSDGFATGLIVITETGGDASRLEGDYFRIDSVKDFASGNRMMRSEEYCALQEIRFVDFGSGSRLHVLIEEPQGVAVPSFSYTAVNEAGTIIAVDDVFTADHLTTIDVADLVPVQSFGTMIFDFSSSGGGFVTAEYSAFGRFSVELNGTCTVTTP